MSRRHQDPTDNRWVYAVVCPSRAIIKIGTSATPMDRLSNLKTGAGAWLFLWAVWKGGREEERRAHEALQEHRARGEWFTAHPDVVTYVLERIRPEWATAVREDYRLAGAILGDACWWAADADESESIRNEGHHRHGPCTVVGYNRHRSLPHIAELAEGFAYAPGPLVSERWENDVGSEFWVLTTPVVELPKPRKRRPLADDPQQPSLFDRERS
jgi:hypothetical protein